MNLQKSSRQPGILNTVSVSRCNGIKIETIHYMLNEEIVLKETAKPVQLIIRVKKGC